MLSVLVGVIVGVVAGLVPGVHTNLIAVIVATLQVDVWSACSFLVAVAVARSVIDAVPSVFLGATDSDVMGVLPGHRLLQEGLGIDAVKFFVAGSVLGMAGAVVLIPLFIVVFPALFTALKPVMFWVLLALILLLIVRERSWLAVGVFGMSGLLGLVSLGAVREPLFPLLSGLFGVSGLVLAIFERVDIPLQEDADRVSIGTWPLSVAVSLGVLAGSVVTLFPGLSPSQAAALSQVRQQKSLRFLVLIGALGTVDVIVSLVTFFVLGKARNGAVVVMEQLAGAMTGETLATFVAIALFATGIAAIAALFISKWYASLVEVVDYAWVSAGVILVLMVMAWFLSGWLGLVVLITATAVGLLAPLFNVSRSHAMGCLLLPTLCYLW